MRKVKIRNITSLLISLSMLFYALRGKAGAIAITALVVVLICNSISNKHCGSIKNILYALFFLVFAVLGNLIRSANFEYYLTIGYFAVALLFLNKVNCISDSLWKYLKWISIFEAVGIYMQRLLPQLFNLIMSFLLPSEVVSSIWNRFAGGWITGFSREVSYAVFLIIIGLGVYIYDDNGIDANSKLKKNLGIAFLLGALVLSGKRASLLFFGLSVFVINFIQSDNKLKLVKYLSLLALCAVLIYILFPIWSQIPSLSRMVELLAYASSNDLMGLTNGRIAIYEHAIALWQKSPWLGIGWGNFKYAIGQGLWYSGFDVHNCYLQILCETGIVGIIAYTGLIVYAVKNSVKCIVKISKNQIDEHKIAKLCCFIQIFFLFYSFTEPILYEYTDYIIFFISIFITNSMVKEVKDKQYSNSPIMQKSSGALR